MTSPSDTPKPAAAAVLHVDDLNDPILKAMANPEPGQCDYCLERDGKHAPGCDALRDGETTGFIADETRPSQATGVGEPFDWKAAWYALDQDNAALSTRALAVEAALASSAAETARLREENERNRQGFEFHAGRAERERERAQAAEAEKEAMRVERDEAIEAALRPSNEWLYAQAQQLSSDKGEDAVGALAWNLGVAFKRRSEGAQPDAGARPSAAASRPGAGRPASGPPA